MNTPLTRRLIVLEQAVGARRAVYRAYTTRAEAEAEADSNPPKGVTLVQIITGVPRSPALNPACR